MRGGLSFIGPPGPTNFSRSQVRSEALVRDVPLTPSDIQYNEPINDDLRVALPKTHTGSPTTRAQAVCADINSNDLGKVLRKFLTELFEVFL